MFLIDADTEFKFGVKKVKGGFIPVRIEGETTIKDGQAVFTVKPYTAHEVIKIQSLKDDVGARYNYIKARISANVPMEKVIPSIIESINMFAMGMSVMDEVDETLFM